MKKSILILIVVGLCSVVFGCSSDNTSHLIELSKREDTQAQVIVNIPQRHPSDRQYINNRGSFYGYSQRGQVIIDNKNANSADIFINGKKLQFNQVLKPNQVYQYDISTLTKDGRNNFHIAHVSPVSAQLSLHFNYPNLAHKHDNTIDFSNVDTLINNDIKAGFPGAVLAVVHKGELIKLTAYGYSKKYQQPGELLTPAPKMQVDTLFDLASNTKIFATNLALMKLVTEQRLDINKPIAFYLPQYKGQGRDLLTVKNLLTHTSGYPSVFHFYKKDNPLGTSFYSQDSALTKQLILNKLPYKSDHSAHHYSDINYVMLGMLIEHITGQSLDDYLQQQIYGPLGLTHTVFNPLKNGFNAQQCAATELRGNTRDGRVQFENIRTEVIQAQVHDELAYYSLGGVAGHAGLFSNAKDLAVLSQMLLNKGGYNNKTILSEQVLSQFLTPQVSDETYGLGFRLAGTQQLRRWHFGPYASPQAYGHTGWTGTATVIDPYYDLAIILLTNARHSEIAGNAKQYQFIAKQYETAKYGSVIALVYEALLNH
ncbi:penicillin binding protein PBP4B [Pseudoalteromonas sp. MMG010]|uniref:penicillin binding protein PBP4B n=1 Tax=Pseudoalteromonas sp. MMG010 TaxID=2822685 RepID=UPI001B3A6EFE|nr:penicillin binding protein PBP4B [Pseudoalteromonas sp. MMG010]